MDPGSEMEARDVFSQANQSAVGWYHSHPMFRPDPSVRDVQTQANYQVRLMVAMWIGGRGRDMGKLTIHDLYIILRLLFSSPSFGQIRESLVPLSGRFFSPMI